MKKNKNIRQNVGLVSPQTLAYLQGKELYLRPKNSKRKYLLHLKIDYFIGNDVVYVYRNGKYLISINLLEMEK